MRYTLLDGETINGRSLSRADLEFLLDLQRRAVEDEDYRGLRLRICSRGSYPLKGSPGVTRAIQESTLFRIAEDVVDRVGLRQGMLAPDDPEALTDEIVSVSEAAARLGISRAAVLKAANAGRLRGKKIGSTWALLRRSVEGYKVAEHRVAAGRARARRRRRRAG